MTPGSLSTNNVVDSRELLGSRPGVCLCGWLLKEGAHTLSRAFPSRRFCVVVDSRLEYYEERTALLSLLPDGSTGVALNKWNLVLHEQHGGRSVMVGDIVTKVDGVNLGVRLLNEVIASHAAGCGVPFKLTVLRPKGEVPLLGAEITKLGCDRVQIRPSPKQLIDHRPPYVLIAERESERNEWFDALEESSTAADQFDEDE